MSKPSEGPTIAAVLEQTCWDYSPADAGIGLLSPMSRYFRGFPWEGRGADGAPAASQGEGEEGLTLEEPEGS